jgi:hypothetical protein
MERERRRSPRYPFFAAAAITELSSNLQIAARTSELSLYGCYMDMMNALPLGTSVKIRIIYAQETFESSGHVIYSQPNMGMGVAFDEIALHDQRILEKWFSDLRGG